MSTPVYITLCTLPDGFHVGPWTLAVSDCGRGCGLLWSGGATEQPLRVHATFLRWHVLATKDMLRCSGLPGGFMALVWRIGGLAAVHAYECAKEAAPYWTDEATRLTTVLDGLRGAHLDCRSQSGSHLAQNSKDTLFPRQCSSPASAPLPPATRSLLPYHTPISSVCRCMPLHHTYRIGRFHHQRPSSAALHRVCRHSTHSTLHLPLHTCQFCRGSAVCLPLFRR